MEMTLSPYRIYWVEFRAQKGRVTKKDAKILLSDVSRWSSYGKNALKHFASKECAYDYLKEKVESFRKLSKAYEVRMLTDKQYSMAKCDFKNRFINVPFTQKQESEMFVIGNK